MLASDYKHQRPHLLQQEGEAAAAGTYPGIFNTIPHTIPHLPHTIPHMPSVPEVATTSTSTCSEKSRGAKRKQEAQEGACAGRERKRGENLRTGDRVRLGCGCWKHLGHKDRCPPCTCMYPPPHMTCMYPPPSMACVYPPPHMTCMNILIIMTVRARGSRRRRRRRGIR